jgi:DNA-binding beta-propeller fold protein YncE
VIDASVMDVIARVPTEGGAPTVMETTPDGRFVYLAARGSRGLSVREASDPAAGSGRVVRILPGSPRTLAVTPDGRFVLSSDRLAGGLRVVDVGSQSYVSGVQTGVAWDLVVTPPPSKSGGTGNPGDRASRPATRPGRSEPASSPESRR